MYLSDVDLEAAIKDGSLIVDPCEGIGATSIDLHLDRVDQAKVWNVEALVEENKVHGRRERELHVSRIRYGEISRRYLADPTDDPDTPEVKVFRRGKEIVVRPMGFLLWQTKERIGTPEEGAKYICFIDGKSTRARTGLVVHLTAPTIHAGWSGQVTLEISNLGPFDMVLTENDVVAQITVAKVSNSPKLTMAALGSVTQNQKGVGGAR